MLESILKNLGLSGEEIKVYLALVERGPQRASNIARHANLARPSVYGFLKRLKAEGLVVEFSKRGTKVFAAEPPKKISALFREKIENLEHSEGVFKKLLIELERKNLAKFIQPRFYLYEGAEGVRHVLKDMLLYQNIHTFAFWPIRSMIDILSPDFFRYLNKERIKNNIYTRAVWPEGQAVDVKKHPYLGVGDEFKREIRIAPKGMEFSMGYWAYGNKAAFISSEKEKFGFIIESKELVEMLSAQFEFIWASSKPLSVNPADTRQFLNELNRPEYL